MTYKLYTIVSLLGLLAVFAIQNATIIEVNFLIWGFEMPRSLLILSSLAIGFGLGWIVKAMRGRPTT